MSKQKGPVTFAFGALAGVFGGFLLGVIFGKYVLQLFTLLYHFVDRKGDSDKERLKFELLLQ